jgi:hypothetical protein
VIVIPILLVLVLVVVGLLEEVPMKMIWKSWTIQIS